MAHQALWFVGPDRATRQRRRRLRERDEDRHRDGLKPLAGLRIPAFFKQSSTFPFHIRETWPGTVADGWQEHLDIASISIASASNDAPRLIIADDVQWTDGVRHQTAEEAAQQDEELAACAATGSCPERCVGADADQVVPRNESLTVGGGSETIEVRIEDIESGAKTSQVFTPEYSSHPSACADCEVAMDQMPVPASVP